MPELYIIATPIGNLADITLRALEIFKKVDFIICEDTRQTIKLLNNYQIKKHLVSYHEHSRLQRISEIIEKLKQGQSACLVSDAGTPGISDPGGRLIDEVSRQLGGQVRIIPVPGPSALAAAASVSGLPCDKFLFLGFLPHKKGRESFFKRIAESQETVIFYESPYRIIKTLDSLSKIINQEKTIVICRELTKIYEEIIRGDITFVQKYFMLHPDKVKGEFVVIVS